MTETLLSWFDQHKRDLPWRQQRSIYRVWIAEIMLQQTQVATVIPYFERWMQRFPTLVSLAQASQDEVLKAWEGLGYYRRARNLHRTAQLVIHDYGGRFPENYQGLKQLPGIGSYTAGAIASLVYGEPVLAIDGNVKRLASRLFALSEVTEKYVAEHLRPLLPRDHAGAFNEALIELGATVCKARNPSCEACPLATVCQAFQQQSVSQYPPPTPRRVIPLVKRSACLYVDGQGLVLHQRQDDLLGGLWGFPLSEEQVKGKILGVVKHVYTHFRIQVTAVEVTSRPPGDVIPLNRVSQLALSRLDYKLLELWRNHNPDVNGQLIMLDKGLDTTES